MSDRLIIDGFVLDLLVSLEEAGESEPTKFPVERGAPITDHVVNNPRTLSLEFRVSDTPIGDIYDLRAVGSVPSAEARAFLQELQDSARPFVVEYQDRRWDDQIFANLSFGIDFDKQGGLFATAELQRIIIADVRRVVVQGLELVVPSRRLAGPRMWLCPPGLPADKDEAINKKRGCRRVVKHDGVLRFDDEKGELLNQEETRRVMTYAGGPTLDPATGHYFVDGHPVTVDAASQRAVERATGTNFDNYQPGGNPLGYYTPWDEVPTDSADAITSGRSTEDLTSDPFAAGGGGV